MQNRQSTLKVKVIEAERRNNPLALILVALVWIGLLAVVFAPKGTFVSGAGMSHVER